MLCKQQKGKGRSTADHILIIQELFFFYRYKKGVKKKISNRHPLYYAFMDLVKAFDMVPRGKLFKKLKRAGVRGKMFGVKKTSTQTTELKLE